MGALVPLLLPAIPTLINLVEKLFPKPQSGTDKMSAVIQALRGIINQLVAAKQLPDATPKDSSGNPVQPTDEALQGLVETVLAQLKGTGQLGATDGGNLYLLRGTVTALSQTSIPTK